MEKLYIYTCKEIIVTCEIMTTILFFQRGFFYRARALTRNTKRDREIESKKSTPRGGGHAAIPSPPFSSRHLGYACTCTRCELKPPGLGLELLSATWEFSDITITLTAGLNLIYFLERILL